VKLQRILESRFARLPRITLTCVERTRCSHISINICLDLYAYGVRHERTADLISKIMKALGNQRIEMDVPTRVARADVIHAAVETYANKLGVK